MGAPRAVWLRRRATAGLPAQLGREEIAVRSEFHRVFVHIAYQPLFAIAVQIAAVLLQNALDFADDRTVERVGGNQILK